MFAWYCSGFFFRQTNPRSVNTWVAAANVQPIQMLIDLALILGNPLPRVCRIYQNTSTLKSYHCSHLTIVTFPFLYSRRLCGCRIGKGVWGYVSPHSTEKRRESRALACFAAAETEQLQDIMSAARASFVMTRASIVMATRSIIRP